MSLKTLPILFLNLGGEMVYILDQRLRAQNIPPEKGQKVMHDILCTMLNKRFMLELFKPQDAYSKKAMRIVFDRLAHASIMRLNAASMDKLYDLMTMALKYQVSLSGHPIDVLMSTLNHMDLMREFAQGSDAILQQVEDVYNLIKDTYSTLTPGEFHMIRQTLLNFFQDMHIRVSIFLKDGKQTPNGRFVLPKGGQVPWGTDPPGTVRFFNAEGQQKSTVPFEIPESYQLSDKLGTFELFGDRCTKLGGNMYCNQKTVDSTVPAGQEKDNVGTHYKPDAQANDLAKAGLGLLEHLICGASKKTESQDDFRLNLFETDEDEVAAEVEYAKIRLSRQVLVTADGHTKEISKLIDEFTIESNVGSGGDDLLDLMDSTCS